MCIKGLNSKIESKKSDKLNYRNFNWTQLTILSLLWNKAMYGLEIKNNLESRQISVNSSQLYPLLKKFSNLGLLTSHKEDRADTADRIFYKTSPKGQKVLFNYFRDILGLFFEGYSNLVGFIGDEIHKLVDLNVPGIIIADLSYDIIESVLVKIVPNQDITAQYFIVCESEEKKNIVDYRVKYNKLDEIVKTYTFNQKRSILPDASVDVVLLLFTLHELETDYILSEAKRILKPNGSIVLADNLIKSVNENFLFDAILQVFPSRFTEDDYFTHLYKLLEENHLRITKQHEISSFKLLIVNKK